jgi:hypothetical protein
MNLKLTLLAIVAFPAVLANAQSPLGFQSSRWTRPLMQARAIYDWHKTGLERRESTGNKTLALFSRLVANASSFGDANSNRLKTDSSYYIYKSSSRGGDADAPFIAGGFRTGLQSDTGFHMVWDNTSQSYTKRMKYYKTYNTSDRELLTLVELYSSVGWQNYIRKNVAYDGAGRDTVITNESFNNAAWRNQDREYHTYNSNGTLNTWVSQTWDTVNSSWVNFTRMTYNYDVNGNETLFLYELWNASTNNWKMSYRNTSTYSNANEILSLTAEYYDNSTNNWTNGYQFLYYYNSASHLIAHVNMNGSASGWMKGDSTSYSARNSTGYPLTSLGYTWNGGWQPFKRYTYTYTSNNQKSSYTEEVWNGSNFDNVFRGFYFYNSYNQLLRTYSEVWAPGSWVFAPANREERLYYETVSTAVGNSLTNPVQAFIYPIPASKYLHLAVNSQLPQEIDFTIYDASGKVLLSWRDYANNLYTKKIDVDCLPIGNYFIQITGQKGYWSGSFQLVH